MSGNGGDDIEADDGTAEGCDSHVEAVDCEEVLAPKPLVSSDVSASEHTDVVAVALRRLCPADTLFPQYRASRSNWSARRQ